MSTKKTIITVAQERGSSAKTRAGAWRYLMTNLTPVHPGLLRIDNREHRRDTWAAECWINDRRDRTADGRALVLGYTLDDPHTPGRILDEAHMMHYRYEYERRCVILRDAYGAIYHRSTDHDGTPERWKTMVRDAAYWDALGIISDAARQEKIDAAYDTITWDHKRRADGDAVHHEMYDYRPGAVIVCVRYTEGSRYGVQTKTKKYFLLEKTGDEITAQKADMPVAKYAKTGAPYGSIIARVKNEPDAAKLPSTAPPPETGYKCLAVVDDELCSVYSGETYKIGEQKHECAKGDHNGGYYYFKSINSALNCEFPKNSKFLNAKKVVVRCEVSGRRITYDTGKHARTNLMPVEIVASRLR